VTLQPRGMFIGHVLVWEGDTCVVCAHSFLWTGEVKFKLVVLSETETLGMVS
jgi:hypothetical protein